MFNQSCKKSKVLDIRNLVHRFVDRDEENRIVNEVYAVDDVSLEVEKGDFIAILGHNGSGKSTLAKHINGILKPTSGTLYVNGKDVQDEDNIWKIRQEAGMVFQNPDNQIIATVVEEDVGFGPENLGVPSEEIWERVAYALSAVEMQEYRNYSPGKLSGGQKQRVAIAGVLAMKPDCIILDEPTAMLDPIGRKEVMKTLHELNQKEQVTIILITHHMDEVIDADKVFVMNEGKVMLQGTPREIFSEYDSLREAGLDVPVVTKMARLLKQAGIEVPTDIIHEAEFMEALNRVKKADFKANPKADDKGEALSGDVPMKKEPPILSLHNVNYIYSPGTIYERQALRDITLDIYKGEFLGIVGHTGSGKSTLIQHFNGLNKPSGGDILYREQSILEKGFLTSTLCKKIGLVFQYPEYQLFEATVLQDVSFGPKNLGMTQEEAETVAKEALQMVGMNPECYQMSPFELSGGQKRRVAIAGILAMQPEVLVLDEPTAALDPKGKDEIFNMLMKLHREKGITIVLVSHCMEDIARYTDRMIVIDKGAIVMEGAPREVFQYAEKLEGMGLMVPETTHIMKELENAGWKLSGNYLYEEEGVEAIRIALAGRSE